jgi:hypothetical protein
VAAGSFERHSISETADADMCDSQAGAVNRDEPNRFVLSTHR